MAAELILSMDCGTQSIKAMVFDLDGQIQAKAAVALTTQHATVVNVIQIQYLLRRLLRLPKPTDDYSKS